MVRSSRQYMCESNPPVARPTRTCPCRGRTGTSTTSPTLSHSGFSPSNRTPNVSPAHRSKYERMGEKRLYEKRGGYKSTTTRPQTTRAQGDVRNNYSMTPVALLEYSITGSAIGFSRQHSREPQQRKARISKLLRNNELNKIMVHCVVYGTPCVVMNHRKYSCILYAI